MPRPNEKTATVTRGLKPADSKAVAGGSAHDETSEVIGEFFPANFDQRLIRGDTVSFGKTVIFRSRRQLLRDGVTTDIGDRAFDLLLALIEAHGSVLSKDEIMSRVWPGRIVEENTIEGQMSGLRRALGEDRTAVRTVAGRGYQFVGELMPVVEAQVDATAAAMKRSPEIETRGKRLPANVSPIIGRETALREVGEIALSHRLVTLVGSGGVGKTRLAVETARQIAKHFADGAYIAELAALSSSEYLYTTVAAALGVHPSEAVPSFDDLGSLLRDRHLLLLLDNCEHLVESAARMAETLLRVAARVTIIATSREALRVAGEYIYRVGSLEVPPDDASVNAGDFGAIQLLEERLTGNLSLCSKRLTFLPLKVRICRQLDGIPLAIELAAACVPILGLHGVAECLDDRFRFLTHGARTALPRQQTLRAMLDWSYELLPEDQALVLNRLSVFPGSFALDSAQAVVACEAITPGAVLTAIVDLVNKSLVSALTENGSTKYRLLETTRAYAHDRLSASDEMRETCERHARHFLAIFRCSEQEAASAANIDWSTTYTSYLEDLRAAIAWGFSPQGDSQIAVDLTIASIPVSMQLALLEECLSRVNKAIEQLERDVRLTEFQRAMKLYAARGACLLYQSAGSQTGAAFRASLKLADEVDDVEYQLRGLWGCWSYAHLNGQYAETLHFACRFSETATRTKDITDQLVAFRLRGIAHLCLGALQQARADLERAVKPRPYVPRTQRIRFLYDESVLSNTALAHTLWLMGSPDQATYISHKALAGAQEIGHPSSLCYALSTAVCPIALLTGDDEALSSAVHALTDATRRHGVSTWKARAQMWQAFLELREGCTLSYDATIQPIVDRIGAPRFFVALTPFQSATGLQLGRHGEVQKALTMIANEIDRAREAGDECSLVELQRVKAELTLNDIKPPAAFAAQVLLTEALTKAHNRGFLAWELRIATSLAALLQRQGKSDDARRLLAPVYERFSEGFNTRDLRAAHALLQTLR